MSEIKIPKLGLTMQTGLIKKWLKREGDKVVKGDVLVEIETDKVTTEIISDYDGTLIEIIREEGEEVPILEIIGYIE
jgi:pyruvate/2-oxoglutarate dehydrogenase complex dihydrolipoamide acyltransferase (E2) component